ncbi:MAG: hypothetical protein SPI12_05705 [Actinomycetaceae bacterium]|nr:hypothetical protein [Actinomycetaceae bacterium]MDY6083333.1 hypothetical protein [Actinomycetaceae bacterium]
MRKLPEQAKPFRREIIDVMPLKNDEWLAIGQQHAIWGSKDRDPEVWEYAQMRGARWTGEESSVTIDFMDGRRLVLMSNPSGVKSFGVLRERLVDSIVFQQHGELSDDSTIHVYVRKDASGGLFVQTVHNTVQPGHLSDKDIALVQLWETQARDVMGMSPDAGSTQRLQVA